MHPRVKIARQIEIGINRFSRAIWKARKTRENVANADKTKTRGAKKVLHFIIPAEYPACTRRRRRRRRRWWRWQRWRYRSCSISAVHFMLRIVTHAREPRGGTNISRTLYDLRNINIFLLPTTRSYDPTHFLLCAFLTCVFYASRNYKRKDISLFIFTFTLINHKFFFSGK